LFCISNARWLCISGTARSSGFPKKKLNAKKRAKVGLGNAGKYSIADKIVACTAYTRYMLDIGQSEDWLALQVSFAPCLIGYAVIARRLYDEPRTIRKGNIYWKWIENYTDTDYTTAVKVGSGELQGTP